MSLQRNEPVRQHPAPQQDERHPPRLAAVTQPPEVRLWWRSAAERNRKLGAWREAVMRFFGEQPRVLRIAWALDGLFNLKTGYAHPSNTWLSRKTGTTMRNVPKALAELEDGGAIVRVVKRSGGTERMIYPAATLLWGDPTVGPGGMATVDTPGDVYRADMQNLKSQRHDGHAHNWRSPAAMRAAAHDGDLAAAARQAEARSDLETGRSLFATHSGGRSPCGVEARAAKAGEVSLAHAASRRQTVQGRGGGACQ